MCRLSAQADYKNFEPLVEVVVKLKLSSGVSQPLRALIDTGATDNFIHTKTVEKLKIPTKKLSKSEFVTLGAEGSNARVTRETLPIKLSAGKFCQHNSKFTILNLEDYDLILGRPFQKYVNSQIIGDDVLIPTKHGQQIIPKWITQKQNTQKIFQVSRSEIIRDVNKSTEKIMLTKKEPPKEAVDANADPFDADSDLSEVVNNNVEVLTKDIQKILRESRHIHKTQKPEASWKTFMRLQEQHKNPHIDKAIKQKNQTKTEIHSIPRTHNIPELEKLIKKYEDLFPADLPTLLPDREFEMKIPVQPGSTPPAQAPYRPSVEAEEAIQQTLEYLYSHNFARDSTSEYAAPVLLVKKSDGTWRFCVDYRKINKITKEAKYPLPRIDDCLDRLGKAKYFSKIDLRSGYWQMKIAEDDIEKTAFRTQYGHHEWLVMPFGLQGAPSCFQRMMNHYLRKYLGKFVLVYLDDILIYSNTREEHLEHIQQVLQTLREKTLYAKGSKCDFFRTEISFLGFRVSEGHIDTDPGKISAIKDWPIPTTVQEIRSFLGMCNFYRKFIQDHATIAKPLTDVLKSTKFEEKYGRPFTKTAPVTLGDKEIQAFETLKKALTTAPCLVIYDPNKPTEVWADASWEHSTLGAVLLQDHGKGLQPVAFLSKVMNSAESRYPTFEQELLALKTAFVEWRHYLLPINFKARTDHNGLKYLKTQKHLTERQWHWLAFFAEYTFDLEYRPGAQMTVPDSLSRKPTTDSDINELLRVGGREEEEGIFEIPLPPKDGKPQRVLLTLKKPKHENHIPEVFDYSDDPDYGEVFNKVKTGNTTLPSDHLYDISKSNLIWIDKRQNSRICVPAKYRATLISEFHDTVLGAHFGAEKTLSALQKNYIWPSMKHHVNQFVLSCDACQKNKARHQKPHGKPSLLDVPDEPWQSISIDFCGPFPKTKSGNDYIMGVICNLTREAILIPCKKEISASATTELFIQHVMRRCGLPKSVNSDRGPQFISNFWKSMWKQLGTKVALSAPYHPQSNALIERQNKTFIEALRSFVNALQDDWDKYLITYEFAYNNSINESTGETPFYLNHGRHPTIPVMVSHESQSPAATDFVKNLQSAILSARDHILASQAQRADSRVKDLTPHNFKVGDLVLLNTAHYNLQLPSLKLAPKFLGPLKILELRGPNTVKIQVPPRLKNIQPLQNVQHLREYRSRANTVGPEPEQQPPVQINQQDEYEVEEIIAHRGNGNRTQYLVRFKSYGPEDDLWLPKRNLANAGDILDDYIKRQTSTLTTRQTRALKSCKTHLLRAGHHFYPV